MAAPFHSSTARAQWHWQERRFQAASSPLNEERSGSVSAIIVPYLANRGVSLIMNW
jgi:hypothetical protein